MVRALGEDGAPLSQPPRVRPRVCYRIVPIDGGDVSPPNPDGKEDGIAVLRCLG
jgi:hypothetical protein